LRILNPESACDSRGGHSGCRNWSARDDRRDWILKPDSTIIDAGINGVTTDDGKSQITGDVAADAVHVARRRRPFQAALSNDNCHSTWQCDAHPLEPARLTYSRNLIRHSIRPPGGNSQQADRLDSDPHAGIILLGTSKKCHRSSGGPIFLANDSALFSFRFCAVHLKEARDRQLQQFFEVPCILNFETSLSVGLDTYLYHKALMRLFQPAARYSCAKVHNR
jgi:hypothetical protein